MFIHKINDQLSLKLIDLRDSEGLFELTNRSRGYLREWLPWLDITTKLEDTIEFIEGCLKGFSENKGLQSLILFKGEIVGVAGYNNINWSNKTA